MTKATVGLTLLASLALLVSCGGDDSVTFTGTDGSTGATGGSSAGGSGGSGAGAGGSGAGAGAGGSGAGAGGNGASAGSGAASGGSAGASGGAAGASGGSAGASGGAAGSGGSATGGAAGSGGVSTGGSTGTGGVATGGTGGVATGGTGGVATGGTGGVATGGTGGVATGGTGGGTGISCQSNAQCKDSDFCAKTSCNSANGTCTPRPVSCADNESPVCGCDGISYWNDCLRQQYGVASLRSNSACMGFDAAGCGLTSCPSADASCATLRSSSLGCLALGGGVCWMVPKSCPTAPKTYRRCGTSSSCASKCEAIKSQQEHHADNTCS
ncbi:MAG: hypothetical protein KF718_13455 [Polyangiaceae bacterium]|nr:hypothetical protein [Polyangiaceae bacterium]